MEKIIYVLVSLTLESGKKITENDIQKVVNEMDYNFSVEHPHIKISDTEIKEEFTSYPKFI